MSARGAARTMSLSRRALAGAALAQWLEGQIRPARKYRAVLIGHTGRGNFGHDWDLSWNGFSSVEVVAAADPDEAGLSRAVSRSGARRGYADYRRMLEKEKPDLVTICPRWMDQRAAMFTAAVEA